MVLGVQGEMKYNLVENSDLHSRESAEDFIAAKFMLKYTQLALRFEHQSLIEVRSGHCHRP